MNDRPFRVPDTHGYEFTPEQWDTIHEMTHGDLDVLEALCLDGLDRHLSTDQLVELIDDHHDRTYHR